MSADQIFSCFVLHLRGTASLSLIRQTYEPIVFNIDIKVFIKTHTSSVFSILPKLDYPFSRLGAEISTRCVIMRFDWSKSVGIHI